MSKVKNHIVIIFKRIIDDIKEYRGLIGAVVLYLVIMGFLFHTFCPVYAVFHYPCPGCGLTRGCVSLLKLDIDAYLKYNACAPLWIGLIIYSFICRYIRGTEIKKWNIIVSVVSVITCIYYIYRFITKTLPY